MTAETDLLPLPERVEALLTSPCFRTTYRGWQVEVAEIEREWMDRLRAEIAAALDAAVREGERREAVMQARVRELEAELTPRMVGREQSVRDESESIVKQCGGDPTLDCLTPDTCDRSGCALLAARHAARQAGEVEG